MLSTVYRLSFRVARNPSLACQKRSGRRRRGESPIDPCGRTESAEQRAQRRFEFGPNRESGDLERATVARREPLPAERNVPTRQLGRGVDSLGDAQSPDDAILI